MNDKALSTTEQKIINDMAQMQMAMRLIATQRDKYMSQYHELLGILVTILRTSPDREFHLYPEEVKGTLDLRMYKPEITKHEDGSATIRLLSLTDESTGNNSKPD